MSADYDLMEFFAQHGISSSFLFYEWPIPSLPPVPWKTQVSPFPSQKSSTSAIYVAGSGWSGMTGGYGPSTYSGISGWSGQSGNFIYASGKNSSLSFAATNSTYTAPEISFGGHSYTAEQFDKVLKELESQEKAKKKKKFSFWRKK